MMKDENGRAYLLIANAKAGQTVELDGGFTCCKAGKVTLHSANDGTLWFPCSNGMHFLAGQQETEDGTDYYVGVYPCNS